MKLNFPIFRPSGPLSNRGAPSGLRRTHILQRTAGKLFHQWAEVRKWKLTSSLLMKDLWNGNTWNHQVHRHRRLSTERERSNTIARPGLRVYAAPRRITPSPHCWADVFFLSFFSLFTKFFCLCLDIAFALGTEWSGDWCRDLLINTPSHSFYSFYGLFCNIVEIWRWPIKAETCSFMWK
jgi:hypothetical protein